MPTLPSILPGPSLPGVVAPAAPTSPAAPVEPNADPKAGGSFVDQLAAAVAALVAPQPSTASPQAPADDGATDTDPEPNQAEDDKDKAAQPDPDAMLELLASFGLLPTPVVAPTPAMATGPSEPEDQGAPLAATTPGQPPKILANGALPPLAMPAQPAETPLAMPATEPGASDPATATPTDAGQPSSAPTDLRSHLPSTPDANTLAAALADPSLLADATQVQPGGVAALPNQVLPAATQPGDQPAGAAEPRHALTAVTAAASGVRAARGPGASEASPLREPGPTASITSGPAHAATVEAATPGSQTSDAGQHGQSGHDASSSRADASAGDSSSRTNEPSATTAATPFAAVAPMQTTAVAAPDAPQPREVVAQIAHQAELYRLPGGRGVRIQLHPDGLGGVEVTVRYGNAGALELHVNVEHAATGALVQSGWTELRDALSQQGISPDRLVMSVSGPQAGGLSSDSGSFGSGSGFNFRSDAGAMGFGQSSQGQQDRQPASGARTRWAPSMDAPPQEEPAAPASTSRIDLRV